MRDVNGEEHDPCEAFETLPTVGGSTLRRGVRLNNCGLSHNVSTEIFEWFNKYSAWETRSAKTGDKAWTSQLDNMRSEAPLAMFSVHLPLTWV